MTIELAAASARLAHQLEIEGYQLGLVVDASDAEAVSEASATLEEVGIEPSRRLAQLRPRIGENFLRSGDLIDFIERYGHEYVAVLLSPGLFDSAEEQARFETTCRDEGCELIWRSTPQKPVEEEGTQ